MPDVCPKTFVNSGANMEQVSNNPLCGEKWQSLLLACEGVVPDFNFITLLRPNVYDFPYHDDLLRLFLVVDKKQGKKLFYSVTRHCSNLIFLFSICAT